MNLYDPGTLTAFLKRYGLRADKGLGQHFLVSQSAVQAIVNALDGCQGVLEIGPGPGVLTHPVSERAERTIALELDPRFVNMLAESAPKAEVRRVDALQADIPAILAELPEPRAIVSNLPYYITAPLLQRVADSRSQIDRAVLMMQKEVANRIAAPPGDGERGSLSVYLQALFGIRRVASVPAGAFLPPPKVDSTVLLFQPRPDEVPESVFRTVRMGFTQPRKTLANNLAAALHRDRDPLLDLLENLGHREKVRAQDLTLEQWMALSEALSA
ncbi:MAG: 16S rRNA (adenine(1518)-N(6)/adenine(1519)-N(6))-dimethyltransferase RsmA [Fimbriimonas sp.]